jgi:hypothetical protein
MLVITPDDRMVHTLNETGAAAFRMLQSRALTVPELADALAGEFEASRNVLAHDLAPFVADLCGKGVLVAEGTAA